MAEISICQNFIRESIQNKNPKINYVRRLNSPYTGQYVFYYNYKLNVQHLIVKRLTLFYHRYQR